MEFKVSKKNVCTSISVGLDREYKGKVVKISYQDFKNSLKNLKLQDDRNNFEEFRAEIKCFTEDEDGDVYVHLYIIDNLYTYCHKYCPDEICNKPLGSWLFRLKQVGDKYICDEIKSIV